MKKTAIRIGLILGLCAFNSFPLLANVIITVPTGGQNVSADKALNSTNGAAFTALGSIVLKEVLATDFAIGNNQSLVLTIPAGWQFKPGVGAVTFSGSRNITAASLAVVATKLTVTFSVGGNSKLDTLTVSGLQVQAQDGANVPGAEYLRRLYEDAGTAVIAGIEDDFTTFGLLNQLAGAAKALTMVTQPPSEATAGSVFSPAPAVQLVDQFGNLCNLNNTTVVTAARAAGTGTLQGTLTRTASFGVATFPNLSHNVVGTITLQFSAPGLVSATSAPIAIGPAPADRLVFTTQPASACVGAPFGIQPVLRTQDRFGGFSTVGLPASKLVTVGLSSGTGALLGTVTLDIGTGGGNGTATFDDLQINVAGVNKQLTASAGGLSNAVSTAFAVSAGLYSKLQLLVPGETAAPGTVTGKTGTPLTQSAGVPFNVTVRAVDANWNLVETISDLVAISSSSATATVPASSALASGSRTFSVTLNSLGTATLTAADLQAGNANKTASTSPAITVVVGPARRLAIQFPPSALGTAGVPFAAQPAIRVVDGGGNLVTTDNGRVITVARSAGTAGLQGTLTATTVNGVATFANLSYNKAETIALNFTAAGLTNIATGNILISPGPFAKLQLLVPGESAAPATASGKTGTPIAQVVDAPFTVIARSVDAYWNLVNSGTDLLGITSSDTNATLPASAALTAGVQNFSVRLNTTGSRTVTATDLTDGSKSPNTSPVITVNAAQYTPATGGSAISADTVGGAWTTLTGPVYTEKASGNVGLGTIILNAPDGFVFDTAGTNPAVLLTRVSGKGKNHLNINGMATGAVLPLTSVSGSQLVLTVTNSSSAGVICRLTWRNIRVRPSAGTPLALGYLTRSGTASVAGLSTNSYLGTLREVPGAASRLVFVTQPGNGVEGELLVPQPVIRACDQFGNASSAGLGATRSLTITLSAGSGPLLGTTGFNIGTAAGNGLATCTDLRINATGSDMQLTASASNLVSAVSSTFNVGAKSAAGTASATTGDVNSGAPSSSIGQPAILTSIQLVKGGVRITLTGPSGRTWQVQRAGSVADHDATWENIGSATTDDSGAAEFLDKHPFAGQGFYRAVQP